MARIGPGRRPPRCRVSYRPVARRSQFQPPSGHCQRTSGSASSSARRSRPSPSREHTARAFPSWEAWARASRQPSRPLSGAPVLSTSRRWCPLHGLWFAGRDAQLDQGHQPPVGACPFAVRVDVQPSVAALTRQQRPHRGAIEDLSGTSGILAEQIPPDQQADSGVGRGEQPGEGVAGRAVHCRRRL